MWIKHRSTEEKSTLEMIIHSQHGRLKAAADHELWFSLIYMSLSCNSLKINEAIVHKLNQIMKL